MRGRSTFSSEAFLSLRVLTTGLVVFLLAFFREQISSRKQCRAKRAAQKNLALGSRVDHGFACSSSSDLRSGAQKRYVQLYNPPSDALQIFIVGKQWMWKAQHPGGQREINELHVPAGQDVRLVMASQDVIHSFYIPALRIKQDVVPGRYETMWFRADKAGRYHLFCAEYCGTDHAHMGGWLTVMNPRDFADWLPHQGGQQTLASEGRSCSADTAAAAATEPGGTVRAPQLEGVFGSPVPLSDGSVVIADERYVRDSILNPEGAGRGWLCSGHADLRWPDRRGRSRQARRLHQVHRTQAGAGGNDVTHRRNDNYLNAKLGIRSWLLTTDHKRIALLYFAGITFFFFIGGRRRDADPARADHAAGRPRQPRFLQSAVHHARHHHGVVLPHPVDPGDDGKFHPSADDRRARPRLSADSTSLSWYLYIAGRADHACRAAARRRRHRLDLLRALFDLSTRPATSSSPSSGSSLPGFSSILTGLNFIVTVHKLRAPGMTWYRLPVFVWSTYATSLILVLATPVLAMTLLMLLAERVLSRRHLLAAARRRPAALPAHVLVLQPPGGLHHDPAVDGRDQRGRPVLRPQAACSATNSWSGAASRSRRSASSSGATTCSSPGSRSMPALPSRSSATSSRCPRRSRCSTGRRRCTRAGSASTRRCSTRLASSACSRSAG